jgi:hypothetical protein
MRNPFRRVALVLCFSFLFLSACTPPNTPPVISQPNALSIVHNTLAAPEAKTITFTVSDKEDVISDLSVSASASDTNLITLGSPSCDSAGQCNLNLTIARTTVATPSVTLTVKDKETAQSTSTFAITIAPEEKTVTGGSELKTLLESAPAGTSLKLTNTTPILHENQNLQIILGKELTLWGLGPDKTFVDAQSLDRLFWIQPTGKVILRDMTLSKGNAQDDGSTLQDEPLGGAIFNEGSLTLDNVRILSSRAVRGGAVYTLGPSGTTIIRDSIIGQSNASNVATRSGGGLFNDAGRLELYNTNVSFNEGVERGGGVYNYLETATLIVEDSLFSSNISWDGTAIKNELGDVMIRGSTIENNTASRVEGGAIFNLSGRLELYNSTLRNNQTLQGSGGAIYSLGATSYVLLDATTLLDNKAKRAADRGGVGGAIYNETGAGLLELRNGTVIKNNSSDADGGAIFSGGPLKISGDCQVSENTANLLTQTFKGGGLYNAGTLVDTDTTVLAQVFTNNQPDNVFTPPPGLRYIVSIGKFVLVNKPD